MTKFVGTRLSELLELPVLGMRPLTGHDTQPARARNRAPLLLSRSAWYGRPISR